MEGQQFLLQAKDVAAVIDWIEVGVVLDGWRRNGRRLTGMVVRM